MSTAAQAVSLQDRDFRTVLPAARKHETFDSAPTAGGRGHPHAAA